jgi:hypothetical protein
MFRIAFDWPTGRFVVQVRGGFLTWKTVCEDTETTKKQYRRFETYTDARTWVNMIGLADALREEGKLEQQKVFHIVEQVTGMKL